jgi:hypothetical protein
MVDVMGERLSSFSKLLDSADAELNGIPSPAGRHPLSSKSQFLRLRIRRLREFQAKAQSVWGKSLVKLMLK